MILVYELLFWICVSIILYTFVGYLLLLKIVSLFENFKKVKNINNRYSVTLLISAYNEEKVIEEKLINSLKLEYENLQIIVSSDGSSDQTIEKTSKYLSDKVKVLNYLEHRGKNSAINDSVSKIDTDLIIFSDADVLYKSDCIEKLVASFSNDVGCVVGEYKFLDSSTSPTSQGEGLYWKYEILLRKLEGNIGSLLVSSGSVCAIRRDLFSPLNTSGAADDMQIPIEILSKGYSVVYEEDAIAYLKTATDLKDEFRRKIRIINQGLYTFKVLKDKIKGFTLVQFISHKCLRWLLGIWAILLYLSNLLLLNKDITFNFYGLIFIMQNIFYLLAIIGYIIKNKKNVSKIFYIPFYFSMISITGIVALFQYFTGGRYVKWEKAESAR